MYNLNEFSFFALSQNQMETIEFNSVLCFLPKKTLIEVGAIKS